MDRNVKNWINESSEEAIGSRLGIKAKFIKKENIKLFVVGRTHANYSGNSIPKTECAWCQWYHLLAIISYLKQHDKVEISKVFEMAKNTAPQRIKILEPKN